MIEPQFFTYNGHELAYREYGSGSRVVVLLHGLLLNQLMHEPVAQRLAALGNRVITLDVLGHGESDRPADMYLYGMTDFGRQTVALLDHLEVDQAVIAGTSLGANIALEIASIAPDRVRGMVLDMPVLDNALLAAAIAFTPLTVALTFGERLMQGIAWIARKVPREPLPLVGRIGRDFLAQDARPGGAVLQGIFFNRIAPHRNERRTFKQPALIIGHRRDPVHPFSDAGALRDELENSRTVEATSLIELRTRPDRLVAEISTFLNECWLPAVAPAKRGKAKRTRAEAV